MAYVKASEREKQVVAAARRVLDTTAVADLTMRAVAVEAGFPLGTMQYVFPTKDQLLRAVIASVVEEISDAGRAEFDPSKGLAHAIREGTLHYWDTMVETKIGLQLTQYELTMYALRTEGQNGLARMQYERYWSLITERCKRAAETTGEQSAIDFDTLARMILAIIGGLTLQYVAHPDPERARQDLSRALDMVVAAASPYPAAAIIG